jgi:hypothetical protein
LSLRLPQFPASAFCITLFILTPYARAQQQPAPAPAPASPPPAATTPPASTTARKPAAPDYLDPRTLTIGISYWLTIPGTGPDLREGKAGTAFGTVDGLGGDHKTPGAEISYPITRTGVLRFEAFLSKGDGTQTAPQDTNPFGTTFNKGDLLVNQYQVTALKLYLDDLLYPFKFPAARFRLKSLWEVQYIAIKSTIDAPLKPLSQDSSGNVISTTASGSRNVIFPTFGVAAEYDLAPHLMFRVGGSGFGLPHRAGIWDAEATISYRHGHIEAIGGAKALHVKTSPQKDEYVSDTLDGGFVGLRWHF